MKTLFKLISIISVVFILPKLSNAQAIQWLGTPKNIVDTRNIAREDSAHEFGQRDTSNHSYRAGTMISYNGSPYWWNGVRWYVLTGDTASFPGQVNSDWNATTGPALILNKPTFATVATSGSYTDLTSKPTIPAAQVNSDWNAISGISQILNEPRVVDSIYRIIGKDSIYYVVRHGNTLTTYSILDSLGAGGGGGSVDSIAVSSLSPLFSTNITNNGTPKPSVAFTLSNASAYNVLGNFTGSNAQPTYGLIPINSLANGTATTLLGYNSSGVPANYTAGTGISLTGNQISFTGAGSSLTSTYVGYGAGGNTLTGTSEFNYNHSSTTLTSPLLDLSGSLDSTTAPTGGILYRDFATGQIRLVTSSLQLVGVNGVSISGDTIYWGNSLTQPTTIATLGNPLYYTGLPSKTPISTDSVMLVSNTGQLYKALYGGGGSGGSQTFQQTLTQGSTLTTSNTATMGTNNFTWSGSGTMAVNAPFTTNSTVSLSGLAYNAGSSLFDVVIQDTATGQLFRQPYYLLNTSNLASGDSILKFNGTQIVLTAGGGGGGGAVNLVSNSDGTLTISPTSGNVVASVNTAHPFTWTGATAVNAAFSTNSTVTLTGLAYNAGGSLYDVLIQDTANGAISRQPYYQLNTSNLTSGDSILKFNGTSIVLTSASSGVSGVTSVAQSVPTALLTVSGTPITSSGTLAISLQNAAVNSFWGNPNSSIGTPSYMTPTQATANLNVFSSSLKGLVPSSGGGTTAFLRADGAWTAPTLPSILTAGNTSNTGQQLIMSGFNTTSPQISAGNMIEQSYAADEAFFGNNIFYNSGVSNYQYISSNPAEMMTFANGKTYFYSFTSGTAGSTPAGGATYNPLTLDQGGVYLGGASSSNPTLTISNNSISLNTSDLPVGTTTDSVLVFTTVSGIGTFKKVAQSSIGGGSTPTLQQVLSAGTTVTNPFTIHNSTNVLNFSGAIQMNGTILNGTYPTTSYTPLITDNVIYMGGSVLDTVYLPTGILGGAPNYVFTISNRSNHAVVVDAGSSNTIGEGVYSSRYYNLPMSDDAVTLQVSGSTIWSILGVSRSSSFFEYSSGSMNFLSDGSYNIASGVATNTTWNLPALSLLQGTQPITIKNIGAGTITVNAAGSDHLYTTSSVTSITIATNTTVRIIAGTSYWYVE